VRADLHPVVREAIATARRYGPLRSCTPRQAPVIRRAAPHDRSVLPRWQRGGDGVHYFAAPAAYQGLRAWRSRSHWLAVVVPLAIKARPEAMERHPVAEPTFTAYLQMLSLHAHQGTGRRCIVRPDRLAELLELSKRTVQRCQKLAEDLGLYVVVTPGRMLTETECYEARSHGSRQRGLSNEAALVVPTHLGWEAWRAAEPSPGEADVTPTSGRDPAGLTPHDTLSLAAAATGAEPPPAAPRHQPQGSRRQTRRRSRVYDPDALRLAVELRWTLPWLRTASPGRLEPGLRRFVRARIPWTGRDLVDAIDTLNTRLGRASMTAGLVRHPVGLLASYLRGLDVDADHPRAGDLDPTLHWPQPLTRTQRANRQRRAEATARQNATPPPASWRQARAELQARNNRTGDDDAASPGAPAGG
jgi:hypothetical protein